MVGLLASWKDAAKLLAPRELLGIIHSAGNRIKFVVSFFAAKLYALLGAYILTLFAVCLAPLITNNVAIAYCVWVAFYIMHGMILAFMGVLLRWNPASESVVTFLQRAIKSWFYLILSYLCLMFSITMVSLLGFIEGYFLVYGPDVFIAQNDSLLAKIHLVFDDSSRGYLGGLFLVMILTIALSYLLDLRGKKIGNLRSMWQAILFSWYNFPLVGFFVIIFIAIVFGGCCIGDCAIVLGNGKKLLLYGDFLKHWIFFIVESTFVILYERRG